MIVRWFPARKRHPDAARILTLLAVLLAIAAAQAAVAHLRG